MKVAVAALKGDKTLAELAEKFDIHPNQITQWRAQLLEGATEVFLTPAEKRDTGPSTKDMQAKIGQQTLEIDFFSRRARSHRRCERKEMIDATHELPMSRQATSPRRARCRNRGAKQRGPIFSRATPYSF